jgi:hypothetical protein
MVKQVNVTIFVRILFPIKTPLRWKILLYSSSVLIALIAAMLVPHFIHLEASVRKGFV